MTDAIYIVVELDRNNDSNSREFSDANGPFYSKKEAQEFADKLNAKNHWAVEFFVKELSLTHWSDM